MNTPAGIGHDNISAQPKKYFSTIQKQMRSSLSPGRLSTICLHGSGVTPPLAGGALDESLTTAEAVFQWCRSEERVDQRPVQICNSWFHDCDSADQSDHAREVHDLQTYTALFQ